MGIVGSDFKYQPSDFSVYEFSAICLKTKSLQGCDGVSLNLTTAVSKSGLATTNLEDGLFEDILSATLGGMTIIESNKIRCSKISG